MNVYRITYGPRLSSEVIHIDVMAKSLVQAVIALRDSHKAPNDILLIEVLTVATNVVVYD